MKMYLLCGDVYDGYEVEMHVYGIFTSKEKAEEAAKKAKKRTNMDIIEFEPDKCTDECLGAYVLE